jgi:glycosyltransferase involved in cell wall biosynthesis
MSEIMLSIVMPCLNAIGTLPAALASLEGEMGPMTELIIADGGSTDGSRELATAHAGARLLPGGDDGLYAGLARGIKAARGDYVLFLNADDRLGRGAVAAYLEAIAGNRQTPMITGIAVVEGDQQRRLKPRRPLDPAAALFGVPAINARAFRRSLFERFGFEPQYGLAADRLFLYSLARAGATGIAIDHEVYRYRSHPGSRTLGADPQSRRRAVAADLQLAEMMAGSPRLLARADRQLWSAWATLQRLRARRWGIAGQQQSDEKARLNRLPSSLALWLAHRGIAAGW